MHGSRDFLRYIDYNTSMSLQNIPSTFPTLHAIKISQRMLILALFLMCFLNACVQKPKTVEIQLQNRAGFLQDVNFRDKDTILDNEICAIVDQEALWETGEEATELRERIVSNTSISIDGSVISADKIFDISRPIAISIIREGKVVGSHGGDLQICFSISDVVTGHHQVILAISNLEGKKSSASWTFDVNG